jgi:hypothetical protein
VFDIFLNLVMVRKGSFPTYFFLFCALPISVGLLIHASQIDLLGISEFGKCFHILFPKTNVLINYAQ